MACRALRLLERAASRQPAQWNENNHRQVAACLLVQQHANRHVALMGAANGADDAWIGEVIRLHQQGGSGVVDRCHDLRLTGLVAGPEANLHRRRALAGQGAGCEQQEHDDGESHEKILPQASGRPIPKADALARAHEILGALASRVTVVTRLPHLSAPRWRLANRRPDGR
jgi:hypothetical protein